MWCLRGRAQLLRARRTRADRVDARERGAQRVGRDGGDVEEAGAPCGGAGRERGVEQLVDHDAIAVTLSG